MPLTSISAYVVGSPAVRSPRDECTGDDSLNRGPPTSLDVVEPCPAEVARGSGGIGLEDGVSID